MGRRIKSIREKLGKNQSEFGELFNPPAPKSAVSRWEHGGSPNKKRLAEIAKLGETTVDGLVYGTLEESVFDVAADLYSHYPQWRTVVDDSGREKYVSLGKSSYDKTNRRNASDVFSFVESDHYISYPKLKKGEDGATKEENSKLLGEYYNKNLIVGLKACARVALVEAKLLEISPSDKATLLRLILEAAERHFSGETATDTGVLNIVIHSMEDATNKLYAITHGIKNNHEKAEEVTYPAKINKKFFSEMESLLDETQEKAFKIASKYNVNSE